MKPDHGIRRRRRDRWRFRAFRRLQHKLALIDADTGEISDVFVRKVRIVRHHPVLADYEVLAWDGTASRVDGRRDERLSAGDKHREPSGPGLDERATR